MNLSRHFTLEELTQTAHRNIPNEPTPEDIERLRDLANGFLEPIRERFGPIRVTSGYRSEDLNIAIGGASDSAHKYGRAADIQAIHGASPTVIVKWVVECSGIDYDQIIDEQRGKAKWVHVGALRPNHEPEPRRQALVMRSGVYSLFDES